ncbi:site-2 protease family protein [Pseudonocardia sp. H11422]|uniref:site-2 protease family protein n=1 Tax=Pseudonocardia sp. H11422 TaxID=2835866 RepID=UPI0020278274|nr:site-2 protease family protein [Pseudonocardia sp. H11422]
MSLPLGRISGIRVRVDLSVFVIVAILVPSLAFGRLPATLPGRSLLAYVFAAVVATALFLASILAHELAHAVVARRNGTEVESITLWMFGGVAELKGDPRSPGADLRIAAVGPLTSLVLAVAFGVAAYGLAFLGVGGLPVAVLGYLAAINVMLALFNLVPAAPLDGGRILRAALWRIWKDRQRAAIFAARAGRGFGYFLIVFGLVSVATGGGFSDLWLVLIGLLIVNAAAAEEQQARLGSLLRGVLVGDVMTPRPVTVDPQQTVDEFIRRAAFAYRFSSYPLTDPAGRLVGLVTLNRIRDVPPERRATTRLGDIACRPDDVPTARPDEPLTDLLPRMVGCADGRAVVTDDAGVVIGIVSPSDVSRAVQLASLKYPTVPVGGADLTNLPMR